MTSKEQVQLKLAVEIFHIKNPEFKDWDEAVIATQAPITWKECKDLAAQILESPTLKSYFREVFENEG